MANEKKGISPKDILEKIETKHNVKNTFIKSGTQIGLTVVGGSIGTVVLGKWSFLTGLSLIGIGNYKDVAWLAPIGTGMMASALMLPDEPASTTPFDIKEEGKKIEQRFVNLKDSFLSKTYLNKVFQKKTASSDSPPKTTQRTITSGEEENVIVNGIDELANDEQTLDQIEQQLIASAREFQKKQTPVIAKPVEGVEPELMGLHEEIDFTSM